ncbi:PAP2 superfamily protein [Pustulibacterium marinum]|uniref:PAP2 superfamily protein n=1 Tax=Pustulibacterium marinum TaxID=1224947 RepID=A0A1I7HTX3_9FLAO|nr:phosphatase PAP2 family protein [Pustulibacterium marinum]SFU64175.1 PAP2 superfamily protein [Pustulibacterium marinum]
MRCRVISLLVITSVLVSPGFAQTKSRDSLYTYHESMLDFSMESLVIPVTLIGYGAAGLENDHLKSLNLEIREEMEEHHGGEKIGIDDFSQYVPALSVYGLNLIGVEGAHSFKDRTIVLATSYLIMSSTVLSLKKITHVQRPDGSTYNSFPSGHTATAFLGAEFLYQEYKNESLWYGITGYAIAAGTGYLRVYNKRHWLTDVSAGAGIGILSVKLAYWLYPKIDQLLTGYKPIDGYTETRPRTMQAMVLPFYNREQLGLAAVINF